MVEEQGRVLAGRLPAGHTWSHREQLATSLMHQGAEAAAEVILRATHTDGVLLADGTTATPAVWHLCARRRRPGYDAGPPEVTERLLDLAGAAAYDLTLLMTPDIPWEPDGVRDDPRGRRAAFAEYQRLLPDAKVIGGAQRLPDAQAVVSSLLRLHADLP